MTLAPAFASDATLLALATGLTLAAALGLYLAQVRAGRWTSARRRGTGGVALLALGLAGAFFGQAAGGLCGPCLGLVILMLALVALPYASAWRGLVRARRHGFGPGPGPGFRPVRVLAHAR